MNEIVVITNDGCQTCDTLKDFLLSLPCPTLISFIDDNNSNKEDRDNIIMSYGSFKYPLIVFRSDESDTVSSVIDEDTFSFIRKFLNCPAV